MAVGAPVPFVLAGLGVVNDDAMIAVTVGDVQFVGLPVDECLGRQPEIFDVVAAFALAGLADLHQELAVLGEFQDYAVVEVTLHAADLALIERAGRRHRRRPRQWPDRSGRR